MEVFLVNRLTIDIRQHKLLSMLSSDGQARLVKLISSSKPFVYPPGCTVIEEGQESKFLFYLIKGEVYVTCSSKTETPKSAILQGISGGTFFGECDVLLQRKRDICVYTATDAMVLRVHRDQLKQVILQDGDYTLGQICKAAQEERYVYKDLLTRGQVKNPGLSRRRSRDEEQDLQRETVIPGFQSNAIVYKSGSDQQDQHAVKEGVH